MISHAGGGDVGYKLVYILYSVGGKKDNASLKMKNNVIPYTKTPSIKMGFLYVSD